MKVIKSVTRQLLEKCYDIIQNFLTQYNFPKSDATHPPWHEKFDPETCVDKIAVKALENPYSLQQNSPSKSTRKSATPVKVFGDVNLLCEKNKVQCIPASKEVPIPSSRDSAKAPPTKVIFLISLYILKYRSRLELIKPKLSRSKLPARKRI